MEHIPFVVVAVNICRVRGDGTSGSYVIGVDGVWIMTMLRSLGI